MQPLQSARSFRTFLHDTQSLSNRRSRLGLFTLEDRQAAGSLMDMLLAGAMASDRAQPIPAPADDPRFGVVTASPLPVIAEVSNAVALVGQSHDEAANNQSVAPNPLGTFAGEGGGQFIGFGDLDAVSNAAPISSGDIRVAPSAFQSPSGPVDESASPSVVRPTSQNAPPPPATSMDSNNPFAAQAAAYLAAIGTNTTPPKFENPTVSFGPMYGYSGGGKVILITKAVVTEVEYLGDVIRIAADPGTPAYPMTGPQYRDINANGIIEPEQGDLQLPIAYARGATVVVTATFKVVTVTLVQGPPGTDVVTIRGLNDTTGIRIPDTIVSWDGGDFVTLPPTSSQYPLESDAVQYYPGFGINWSLAHNQAGQNDFKGAGASFNEMYVTLAKPNIGLVYHTLLQLSVPNSASIYAKNEEEVIYKTWEVFETKAITNKHINPAFSGKPLSYYQEWDTKADTSNALLTPIVGMYNGMCGGFAQLFMRSIRAAGATTTPIMPTQVYSPDDGMLINSWNFNGNGSFPGAKYPYQNTLEDPTKNPNLFPGGFECYIKNYADGIWGYYWGATKEVLDKTGVEGQNSINPKSHFTNHMLIKISGVYYDPSYGTSFNSRLEWEDTSVAGFYNVGNLPNNTFRLLIRKNIPGLLNVDVAETERPDLAE